ncbi:MAG: hypothetical protein RSD14_02945 [Clostridia bacterium]
MKDYKEFIPSKINCNWGGYDTMIEKPCLYIFDYIEKNRNMKN